MTTDLFSTGAKPQNPGDNVPELTVTDLAGSVQRTLEHAFGRIRVRGELMGLKLAGSGHLYGDLKDEGAVINIVCWRSTLAKLSLKPEDGMDVVLTGKLTSYAKSSRYQIVVERMDLAGEGALLKLLEQRRKKLAGEGLFDPARKKPLPLLPVVIGVVTSPSGAVIRDIMHRLNDRFPRHVLLWPVAVQGDGAAQQIAAAIRGFNAIAPGGAVPRPDLLIVARGGGALEDLMAFNDEDVVRAAAQSAIPLISAIGHETDTTLIDHAADRRAPTPTAAAEMAVPVRAELMAWTVQQGQRMLNAAQRVAGDRENRLATAKARLGDPQRLLQSHQQTVDHIGDKFSSLLRAYMQQKELRFSTQTARLKPPASLLERLALLLEGQEKRLKNTAPRFLDTAAQRLGAAQRLLHSLSVEGVLERGFAIPLTEKGKAIGDAGALHAGQDFLLRFKRGKTIIAKVTKPADG